MATNPMFKHAKVVTGRKWSLIGQFRRGSAPFGVISIHLSNIQTRESFLGYFTLLVIPHYI